MQFPNIDQQQALRQLELLGYQPNEPIYLRFFYPSDDPRKDEDKGRKSDSLNFQQIETYQYQGRGVYFVINGGGHKNDDVTSGRAIFCEHDHLPKEIQQELWKSLNLPEPTFQVDTGGKSIHSFWVFNQPIPIADWCQLQKDLLEYTDGDRSIKNPARVMRLAGAWHISVNSEFGTHPQNAVREGQNSEVEYNQSRLISESGKKHSFEELRSVIPQSQPKTTLPLTEPDSPPLPKTNGKLPKHPDEIKIPVAAAVPILECCRKEVREWVTLGIPKGSGRNDTAINVGLELIAVERHLQAIGQPYTDSARQLFSEYCQRSGMSAAEDEERWNWCCDKNPNPSCGDEGIEACIRGFYWRTIHNDLASLSPSSSPSSHTSHTPHTSHTSHTPPSPIEAASLRSKIDSILDQNLNEAQQDLELVQLAKQLDNYNAAEIRAIAHKRIREREEEDNLSERASELERLETAEREEYLPFDDLFYGSPETAQAFKHLCLVNPKIQPQYFLGILSPVSSLVGIKGSVEVPVLGKFRSTINISCVGESGEGKSIVSGILLDPLYRLQQQRRLLNQQEQQQFQQALENWDKQHPDLRGPKPRADEYITTSDAFLVINEYSREGIVKNHLDNPNGLLIHQEELVAIQRAQNMYRQGKGDDRQFLNNLYDNKCISRALKSERIMVEHTAVSIFGGYQPAILQAEMGDLSDPDGQWARFNFVTGIEKQVFTDLSQPTVDVSPLLSQLYHKALVAPEVECRLDKKGLKLLQKFVNEMEELRWRTLQPGMRAVLSKAAGEVCRIALGLHWQNSLLVGDVVPQVIPAIAVKKAIKIKRYFLRQMQLIRTWGDASPHREESLAPIYREVLKIASRVRGTAEVLTVRMVQQARSGLLKNLNAEGIKKLFKDLAAMGKATLVNWKRGIALSLSSLFGDDEGQVKIPVSPTGRQNSKFKKIITPNPEPRTLLC